MSGVSIKSPRKLNRQHCHGQDHPQPSQQAHHDAHAHHAHTHQGPCACQEEAGGEAGQQQGHLKKGRPGLCLEGHAEKEGRSDRHRNSRRAEVTSFLDDGGSPTGAGGVPLGARQGLRGPCHLAQQRWEGDHCGLQPTRMASR